MNVTGCLNVCHLGREAILVVSCQSCTILVITWSKVFKVFDLGRLGSIVRSKP